MWLHRLLQRGFWIFRCMSTVVIVVEERLHIHCVVLSWVLFCSNCLAKAGRHWGKVYTKWPILAINTEDQSYITDCVKAKLQSEPTEINNEQSWSCERQV